MASFDARLAEVTTTVATFDARFEDVKTQLAEVKTTVATFDARLTASEKANETTQAAIFAIANAAKSAAEEGRAIAANAEEASTAATVAAAGAKAAATEAILIGVCLRKHALGRGPRARYTSTRH